MRQPTPEEVITATAKAFCLTTADLLKKKRKPDLVAARRMAINLIYDMLPEMGPLAIARLFNLDNSTVIYHIREGVRLSRHEEWKEDYEETQKILQEMLNTNVARERFS